MTNNKLRKCKGLLNAYGHGCGEMSEHKKFGLGKCCFFDWFNNTDEGKAYKEKIRLKNKTPRPSWQKEKEVNWKKKLQIEINKIAKLIDKGQKCLVDKKTIDCQAGHIISIGSNDTIRFNLHNIHRQSKISNFSQTDDLKLREELAKEYSQEYVNFINQLRHTKPIKLSRGKMKHLTEIAENVVKELQEFENKYMPSNNNYWRIELRNDINKLLGIYPDEFCVFDNK